MANPQIRIIELPTAGTLTAPVTTYYFAIESVAAGAVKIDVNTLLTQATGTLFSNRVTSTTDKGIARFSGTAGLLQGSSAVISDAGVITANGFNSTSSERYKTNIYTICDSLDMVSKLNGVYYTLKTNTHHEEVGLIAEQVEKVLPQVVLKNDKDEPEAIDYSRLVALLINAVNELHTKVKLLESKATPQV